MPDTAMWVLFDELSDGVVGIYSSQSFAEQRKKDMKLDYRRRHLLVYGPFTLDETIPGYGYDDTGH